MDRMMQKKRRVLIGTPCYDGKIDVWYSHSLINTVKLADQMNVEILPIYLSYDALIQRARNDLIALVREIDCDDIIFIDSDIEWNPEHFYRLLNYPVDVVGGTYPKKGDTEIYVGKVLNPTAPRDPITGLMSVEGLGTGFLRLSRHAVDTIWDASPTYEEKDQGKKRRWIFNVVVDNNDIISEDIWMCRRLIELGFKIWLDPTITCNHVGMKKYTGNFESWLQRTFNQTPVQTTAPLPPPPTTYGVNSLNITNRSVKQDIKKLYE